MRIYNKLAKNAIEMPTKYKKNPIALKGIKSNDTHKSLYTPNLIDKEINFQQKDVNYNNKNYHNLTSRTNKKIETIQYNVPENLEVLKKILETKKQSNHYCIFNLFKS